MAEFNISGGPSTDELGQSLLQDARAQSARRRQQERGSTKDAVANLLLGVAGQYIGSTVNQNFNDKLNTFVNSENVLTERALARSAVDESKRLVERDQLAQNHEGGRRAFYQAFLETDIKARTEERLREIGRTKAGLAGSYNQRDIARFAQTKASDFLDDYIAGVDKQLAAAQNVMSTTGGERTAYFEALRNERGANDGFLGKMFRNVNSSFNDETDSNTDRALHRGTISSRIYETSEVFKNVYDQVRRESGSAFIASAIAKTLDENQTAIKKAQVVPTHEKVVIDGVEQTMVVIRDADDQITHYGRLVEMGGSVATEWLSATEVAGGQRAFKNAKRLPDEQAQIEYDRILDVVDEDQKKDFLRTATKNLSGFGSQKASDKTRESVILQGASDVYYYKMGLARRNFGDFMSNEELTRVATAAYINTKNADTATYGMLAGDSGFANTNPLITYEAFMSLPEGIDNLSGAAIEQLRSDISNYLRGPLPKKTPQHVYNVAQYATRSGSPIGSLKFKQTNAQGVPTGKVQSIQVLLREAMAESQRRHPDSPVLGSNKYNANILTTMPVEPVKASPFGKLGGALGIGG